MCGLRPNLGLRGRATTCHRTSGHLDVILRRSRQRTRLIEHLPLERANPLTDCGEYEAQRATLCLRVRAVKQQRHRLRPQKVNQRHGAVKNLIVEALDHWRANPLQLRASLED